jgi:hypothetical protein
MSLERVVYRFYASEVDQAQHEVDAARQIPLVAKQLDRKLKKQHLAPESPPGHIQNKYSSA